MEVGVGRPVAGELPITRPQEGLWLAQSLAPRLQNVISVVWGVTGPIDSDLMSAALAATETEAGALHVNFEVADWRVVQRRRTDVVCCPAHYDLSGSEDPERSGRDLVSGILAAPVDLAADQLHRVGLIKIADDRHLLFLAAHHLVIDGYGSMIFIRRVAQIYAALLAGDPVGDTPFAGPERIVREEEEYLDSAERIADRQFWSDYLDVVPEPPALPSARDGTEDGLKTKELVLSDAAGESVRLAADQLGVWVLQFVSAAVAAYFSTCARSSEFVLRYVAANRSGLARSEVGMLANMVPVKVATMADRRFSSFVAAFLDEVSKCMTHSRYPLSDVIADVGLSGHVRNPLGPAINLVPFLESPRFGDATSAMEPLSYGAVDDLLVSVYELPGDRRVGIRIDANSTQYDDSAVTEVLAELTALLRRVAANPHAVVGATAPRARRIGTVLPTWLGRLRVVRR
ncbi:hypothetical protein F5X71_27715 [Nocardia brasiliensis]|uniref:Condensation domain-containing protein n=1 Tax=Nocardia brasiliensis TaxID=37326 RepID=A0A6G9XXF1_NOCBR|nr:condensation domain-containing protein [Nocardia brasiliensis]QIS05594.1 hypothetical protein F5X71_27715 [Nocardia brasiliensis]